MPLVDPQDSVSTSAVNSPPASPVLMTLLGSSRRTAVSVSARGQCSTPRGTTKRSRGPRTTLRSRIWMVSSPLRTRNSSSVSSCAARKLDRVVDLSVRSARLVR